MAESGNINSGLQVLTQAEHDGDTTPTKKVSVYGYDIANTTKKRLTATATGTHVSLDVAIMDGSGNQITSFGGASASTTGTDTHKTDALVATAVAVKASAGNLYGFQFYNSNLVTIFVHFYNIAQGSVTVGTSARKLTIAIPAGASGGEIFDTPISFDTAITIAATTTITGSAAPTTGILTNIMYK